MSSAQEQRQRSIQRRLEQDLAAEPWPGISLEPVPGTNLRTLKARIHFSPEHYPDSPYSGGTFNFTVVKPAIELTYPFRAPDIFCDTKIYSPHVNAETGQVLFSSLAEEEWSPLLHLNTTLFSMIVAFHEPEPAYEGDHERMLEYLDDREAFWDKAREWTAKYALADDGFASSLSSDKTRERVSLNSKDSESKFFSSSTGP